MTSPIAVLIAGPNGAGKTTFARQFIPLLHPGVPFLNADEIQRESIGLATAVAAAHFIELPSADFAVARVRARVAAGGHDIPEDDIRRRFDRGRQLFDELYKNSFDVLYHWFSDEDGLRLGKHPEPEVDELELLLEAARRATWDAKHGPRHLRSGRFFISASLQAHSSEKLASRKAGKGRSSI